MGGREKGSGKYTSRMMKYDPTEDKWISLSNMKRSKAYFSVLVIDKRILITGGAEHCKPKWRNEKGI